MRVRKLLDHILFQLLSHSEQLVFSGLTSKHHGAKQEAVASEPIWTPNSENLSVTKMRVHLLGNCEKNYVRNDRAVTKDLHVCFLFLTFAEYLNLNCWIDAVLPKGKNNAENWTFSGLKKTCFFLVTLRWIHNPNICVEQFYSLIQIPGKQFT